MKSSEIVGGAADEIFGELNDWIANAVARVIQSNETEFLLDTELVNGDGESYSVNLNMAPLIDSSNNSLGCTLVIEDISKEKRVRSTMARYMTSEIADQVLAEHDSVLGGQAQLATVMFTDIRDFTGLTEELGASGTVSMLNEYFTEMVEVVFENNGILDKYIGDAIMAVFGAPFPSEDDADRAVGCAIDMQQRLIGFNRQRIRNASAPIDIRIGINSDQVVTGNIGSQRRMDYTVIGDGVNVAARLESANKHFGTRTLISAATVKLLQQDYHLRELDLLRIRGKKHPTAIFEVIGRADMTLSEQQTEMFSHFRAGMAYYRARDWIQAVAEFGTALRLNPADRPSQIFCTRSTRYLENPPPSDWDGVWEG